MSAQPDHQLVRNLAEAEATRLILERLILRGIEGEALREAIDARTAALEQLQIALGEGEDDFAHYPAADRTRPKNRTNKPAA